MKSIEHRLVWSSRYKEEHDLVLQEAERVALNGGAFKIENKCLDSWYSIITIYYPEKE